MGVEIYRKLFTTLILKRKTYLKHIKNQGTLVMVPMWSPTSPILGVLVDFFAQEIGVFPLCVTTWRRTRRVGVGGHDVGWGLIGVPREIDF